MSKYVSEDYHKVKAKSEKIILFTLKAALYAYIFINIF